MHKQLLVLLALVTISLQFPTFTLGSRSDFLRVQKTLSQQQYGVINWPFSICDSTNGVNVLYVQMAQKPALGSGANVSIVGMTNLAFNLAKIDIQVYYAGIFLITVPVKDGLPQSYAGSQPFVFNYQVDIPSYAFKGHYKINIKFTDDASNEQLCTSVEMDL